MSNGTVNKYDFIQQLLENKKLSPVQRERVLELAKEEIKKDGSLEDRIQNIEDLVFGETKGNFIISRVLKAPSNAKKIFPDPDPKHVAEFMSLFNQRDGLKYLTHDYDENFNFDIDMFLINANEVFIEKTKKLSIPQSLWRIVKQFAFDSKQTVWTSISADYEKQIQVKIGWATKELRNWSKQNHLHPIRKIEYEEMIASFRRITRVENNSLNVIIDSALREVFQLELSDFKVEKKDLEKADFYSHVGNFKLALATIFEEIKKYSNSQAKRKISIKYERTFSDEGYYLRKVIISHLNSFPTKELQLLLEEWEEKGNMGKIKEKLKGYCHWSVETVIEDVPTKVNILRENNSPRFETIDHNSEGFTHILTFYYK